MYILDASKVREAVKKRGYHSLGRLAHSLGLHRNSIHYYLSGRPVLPLSLEKMLEALNLRLADVMVDKKEASANFPYEAIAPPVDRLHAEFPEVTFVLFGSRARGSGQKYSDWDLGVYSRENLFHVLYRRIVRFKDEAVEDFPFLVDLVNLNRAPPSFLKEASKGWIFLAGRQRDWIDLQRKAAS